VNSFGSGWEPIAGSCEHGNEPLGSRRMCAVDLGTFASARLYRKCGFIPGT
jgi:hypothetical protein